MVQLAVFDGKAVVRYWMLGFQCQRDVKDRVATSKGFLRPQKKEKADSIGDGTCKLAEGVVANLLAKSGTVERVNNVICYSAAWKGVK